jgi:hypothetical protein
MKLSKMTLREQLLVLLTVLVIVGGAYGAFRFYPANKAIANIQKNTQMMDNAMRTGKIPEEPFEDAEDLKLDIEELEFELADAGNMVKGAEQRLSLGDTTEVRLEISEAARTALVRINANEEYRVMVPVPTGATPSPAASAQPQKRLGDGAKRRLKQAERAARQASRYSAGSRGVASVSPDQATELIRKMAINGPMERPMQRLTMEGTYAAIMRFIESLDEMGKMATIVQLQLVPAAKAPPPGYNQRLTATMVLAL